MIYLIYKQTIEPLTILDNDFVKVTETLNNVDIRYTKNDIAFEAGMSNKNKDKHNKRPRKIDKDTYFNPGTKETRKYKHKENRTECDTTFFRTKRELNWLILNNFRASNNELFLTFTYKDKMEDPSRLSLDFRNFFKKLIRRFKNNYQFEYILIREPHLDGSWHMHILLKYDVINEHLIININNLEQIIKDCWNKGRAHVESITNANKLSSYLSTHLTNFVIDENGQDTHIIDESHMTTKNSIKNSRLILYPLNLKIYSSSSNIKKPIPRHMSFANCKEKYQISCFKNWDTSFKLSNSDFAILQRQIQLTKY